MCTKYWADGDVHKYFSPYESPYDSYINFMNVLDNIQYASGHPEHPLARLGAKFVSELTMSLPPPLPKSPPPLPPADAGPLPYAIPTRHARKGVAFNWRLCLWSGAMLIAWMAILVFVLPRLRTCFATSRFRSRS